MDLIHIFPVLSVMKDLMVIGDYRHGFADCLCFDEAKYYCLLEVFATVLVLQAVVVQCMLDCTMNGIVSELVLKAHVA